MQGNGGPMLLCWKNNLIMFPGFGCIHSSLLHTPKHAAAAQFLSACRSRTSARRTPAHRSRGGIQPCSGSYHQGAYGITKGQRLDMHHLRGTLSIDGNRNVTYPSLLSRKKELACDVRVFFSFLSFSWPRANNPPHPLWDPLATHLVSNVSA